MEFQLPKSRAIPFSAKNVKLISSPKEFYEFLVSRSKLATHRIVLGTLYLGSGPFEHNLVESISSNLRQNESLQVVVLLDYLRGTRGNEDGISSTTLLKPLADRASVYLYHTPKLRGFMKHILPKRFNEIIGLQHMKLYIFDDTVLISGANLSNSYFVNRQDRYVVFENCKELADFFHGVITAIGKCSFMLNIDGSIELNPCCYVHPFEGSFADYSTLMRSRINNVISSLTTEQLSSEPSSDTVLYPLLQMGLFGFYEEYEMLKKLLSSQANGLSITMASGYFNCIKEYEELMFTKGQYAMNIVTAAPKANGFFGAAGISGYIPSMYSSILQSFLRSKKRYNTTSVNMYEYHRDGWTFHAKGLWIETATQTATLIGSSNFGYRSVDRDLEAQVLLVTSNERLREQLREERAHLFDFTSILDEVTFKRGDHHIPAVVRILARFVRSFF
ncbi:phospholipase D domain protein [Dictyocaulus viviparus]|uniref:CDP-diacylglycerol--glycerol-3-phosphate 3-phosphatidyltransferase n=1 Tax=Dictyocaulus viviparus TaxID=29172 RepID=A0A0D8Y9A9_DICVI|nr:phospholipase D domain protein [Dictyocaulus viviparus]